MPPDPRSSLAALLVAMAVVLASCASGSDTAGRGQAARTNTPEQSDLSGVESSTSTTRSRITTTTEPGPRLSDAVATALSDVYGPPIRDGSQGWGPPWGAHDAPIDVNPDYDFAGGARPGAWNDPPGQYIQPWCEAFRGADGTRVTDFQLELRRYEYWELANEEWRLVFSSDEAGIGFDGFWGNSDVRSIGDAPMTDAGDGIWVIDWRADAAMVHPWTRVRIQTSPNVEARVGRAQMRVVSGSAPAADLGAIQLLGACTFDYYQNARGGQGQELPGAMVPRHKFVTDEWQWFNAITLPTAVPDGSLTLEAISELVLAHPPPLS